MPTQLSLKKTECRDKLKKLRVNLERDVFFVSGWTDQACLCWTEPYMESGVDRRAGWEYTVKDWEHIIENSGKMHYLQLVENDSAIKLVRNKDGKVKKVEFGADSTYEYTNFFQFAELIKSKIGHFGDSFGTPCKTVSLNGFDRFILCVLPDFYKSVYYQL